MKDEELKNQALNNLNQKNFDLAEKSLVKLLKKYPADIGYLNALAFTKYSLKKIDESIALLKKSLLIQPNQVDCIKNLVISQIDKNLLHDALETLKNGLRSFSENHEIFYLQGNVFLGLNMFSEAVESYKRSLELKPEFIDSFLNLGFAHNKNKEYREAIIVYQRALELNQNSERAHYNLAITFNNIHDYKNAIFHYEQSIKLNPNNDVAKFNLSILYLSQKKFDDGWKLWECRWYELQKPIFTNKIKSCKEIEKNKKTLIWGEQGIGEQILYGSMLTDLTEKENLTISLDKRLLPIYKRSFKNLKFMDKDNVDNESGFDSQIAMGSLGAFLRNNDNSFKGQPKKYLLAEKNKSDQFKDMINSNKKFICGLSWISKNENIGSDKSIRLEEIIKILDPKKFEFIDLQYGDTEKEREDIKSNYGIDIINLKSLDKFKDIDGLASLIDACDFVITVSNVTAHLSGALGKKTFILAPLEFGSMWHWHFGKTSPWYPSVEIFRKKNERSWAEPLKDLSKEIKKL